MIFLLYNVLFNIWAQKRKTPPVVALPYTDGAYEK